MDKVYYPAHVKVTLPDELEQFGLEIRRVRLFKNEEDGSYSYDLPISREIILAKFNDVMKFVRSCTNESVLIYNLDCFDHTAHKKLHIAIDGSYRSHYDEDVEIYENLTLEDVSDGQLLECVKNFDTAESNPKSERDESSKKLAGCTLTISMDGEYVGEHLLDVEEEPENRDEVFHPVCIKAVLPASLAPLGVGLTRVKFLEEDDPAFVHVMELTRERLLEHFDCIMEHVRTYDKENDLKYCLDIGNRDYIFYVNDVEVVLIHYIDGNCDYEITLSTFDTSNERVRELIESVEESDDDLLDCRLYVNIENFDVLAATNELGDLQIA